MRLIVIVFAVAILTAAALVTGYTLRSWHGFQDGYLNPDGELNIWLPAGSTFADLVTELEHMGLVRRGWEWRLLGRLAAPQLKAGEYRIAPKTRLKEALNVLASGQTRQHRLTIVEGWTLSRLRAVLASDPRLRAETTGLTDTELMERLGCEECFAEGWFLPETYFFTRGSTDLDLLRRSHSAMREALTTTWESRDRSAPLQSPGEMLVLASIIERETGATAERSKVAGVFARRLNLGMRLQTDPTVIYGLGPDFEGRLRRVHLRTDHPWNTYTRHGLPPTPIALPGLESLKAAAQPADGTALYFVSRGDGTHQFSDTLVEHNAAVNKYIRGR